MTDMTISEDRASRIEDKLDELITTVNRLAVIDERQTNASIWIKRLEDKQHDGFDRLERVEKKVDRWVNIGIGAWGVVSFVFALYQAFKHLL